MKTLTTERLVLRPIALSDAPALQPRFATWDVISNMSMNVPWPYPDDGMALFLRDHILPAMARGDGMCWAIALADDPDDAIGILEYRCAEGTDDHRGFWIATEHQGRGLMTEAVTAFQDYIFFELGVERIYVHNATKNAASRRVKEKTGATFVEDVHLPHHNGDGSAQRWVVTREAWAKVRGR